MLTPAAGRPNIATIVWPRALRDRTIKVKVPRTVCVVARRVPDPEVVASLRDCDTAACKRPPFKLRNPARAISRRYAYCRAFEGALNSARAVFWADGICLRNHAEGAYASGLSTIQILDRCRFRSFRATTSTALTSESTVPIELGNNRKTKLHIIFLGTNNLAPRFKRMAANTA